METLPAPSELLMKFPLSLTERDFVLKSRLEIEQIFDGQDSRILLIVGPCSLHDYDQSLEYARKLKALSNEVKSTFKIVMRAYFEKPRTSIGWRGLMHDPDLDGTYDIQRGLFITRQLFKAILAEEIPLACEFLDPSSHLYFSDLVSWGCIGARTSISQIHRQMASQLPFPVGFKNSTEGSITAALLGIQVAKMPQTFLGVGVNGKLKRVQTEGNRFAHLVMRGSEKGPNYTKENLDSALTETPYLIVDCSHDNSRKNPINQMIVFKEIIRQIKAGNTNIRGLMLESFLNIGSQPLSNNLQYGISITDPCLDFENTQTLIRQGAKELESSCLVF